MIQTIHFKYAKSLCALLVTLTFSLKASANVHYEYLIVRGFEYEITYDDQDWNSTASASLIRRVWDIETGEEYTIQYEEWNTDSVYAIPSTIDDCPVTSICGGFEGCSDIKTIIIPPTVTKISRGVFANSSLESICFMYDGHGIPINFAVPEPNPYDEEGIDYSCLSVNSGEFSNCKRLKTVEFQRPINKFPVGMFLNCSKLENVYFNPYYVNPNDMSMDTIEPCAFYGCERLTHFEMPKSVKVIGNGAFAHCHNLETIDISAVTSIDDYAFAVCYQLKDVTLNPSLNYLGEAAFLKCESLTSMSIPDSITTIRDRTFFGCHNLADLNLNNVTTLCDRSFVGCYSLTELDLTKARSIGEAAFFAGYANCGVWIDQYDGPSYVGLGSWEESGGVIEKYGSLKKITLGENVTLLNDRTFVGHVPDTITCWAPAPPIFSRTDIYSMTFNPQAYDTTVLRVPQVLVNAYREAYCWNRFVNIQGMTVLGNGDVNGDGQLTISDVTALIDMLLNGQSGAANPINADLNGDGTLSISDITKLIDLLLNCN